MLHQVKMNRAYDPEALAIVGAAFDRTLKRMKSIIRENDKRALALIIIRVFDHGERDPERLAEVALSEWSGTGDSHLRGGLSFTREAAQ